MLASKKTRRGVIGAVVLAGVLAVSGYALTDLITIPVDSHAGDGFQDVEALTVSDVDYTLNGTDPSVVDAVTFDITGGTVVAAPDGDIWIQPVKEAPDPVAGGSTAGEWFSCDFSGGMTDIVCDTTGGTTPLEALDIDQVRVVAAD